jgi:PST family polysaccharide transporter
MEGFQAVAAAMFSLLPVVLLAQVPLARLERALNYRGVAYTELAGLLVLHAVAIGLALRGAGVWAPVTGWAAQQVTLLVLLYGIAGYRPRLAWDVARSRAMLAYGVGYASSTWMWLLRQLVNPLIVGRYAGAEVVGFVALAIRLAEALSFVKTVTSRLSIAALARVGGDARRLTRAVSDGMRLQVLALGPVLIAFTWIGGVAIGLLFGREWLPVLAVFPFVAVASLHHAAFNLHGSALAVVDRNRSVKLFNAAHILLFATSALVLVPRFGLLGYGFAELLALPSYVVLHWQFARHVGSPSYGVTLLWLAVFGVSLFAVELKLGVALLLLAACAWPPSWRELRGLGASMTTAWRTT